MSAKARMQPDPLRRLRTELVDATWSYDFLAEYVSYVNQDKHEEQIFRLLAFRSEPAFKDLSELYEDVSFDDKVALRRSWHERVRCEAFKHDDLRARLSWRYLV